MILSTDQEACGPDSQRQEWDGECKPGHNTDEVCEALYRAFILYQIEVSVHQEYLHPKNLAIELIQQEEHGKQREDKEEADLSPVPIEIQSGLSHRQPTLGQVR